MSKHLREKVVRLNTAEDVRFALLINNKDVLQNTKCGQEVKVTAEGYVCRTCDIVYAVRGKLCDLIYVTETQKELGIRFFGYRYDSKSRPDNNDFTEYIQTHGHNFETDIVFDILKHGFKSMDERLYS